MKKNRWIINEYSPNDVNTLSRKLSVSQLCAKLLINRGFSEIDEAEKFLKKDITGFHSPFLMKDMEKAVKIIGNAIDENKKTLIWGDYDVDGVTSTTILLKYLKSQGLNADYYIPRRLDEGYGLNNRAITEFAQNGGQLLITVDCGITADEEIIYAKSLGMTVIVTDHHECRDALPSADAVINPKRRDCDYPFKELAGVGVAFKLICACEMGIKRLTHFEALKNIMPLFSDFTAIGTIADVMPISDENRLIVNYGLDEISRTKNIGLQTLIDDAGIFSKSYKRKKASSTTIGFIIAPKINAAGRMSTSRDAVDLFMTESREEAARLAQKLNNINKLRQVSENEILQQSIKKIEEEIDFDKDKIIIISDNNWHHGVIGIAASRITEKYNLPSLLISFKNEGHEISENLGKGSGRSIKGFNLVEALSKCSDLLIKYGGHELAAGMSVDRCNFDEFKSRMNNYAKQAFNGIKNERQIEIDCEIQTDEMSVSAINEISLLEPFGVSNPVPIFCAKNMVISSLSSICDNKHTKLILKKNGKSFTAMFFGRAMSTLALIEGDCVDVVFNMDINNYANQQNVQLIVRDICLSEGYMETIKNELKKYKNVISNNTKNIDTSMIPTRDDFKAIYSLLIFLNKRENSTDFEVNIPYLSRLSKKMYGVDVSILKTLLIFDIFNDADILSVKKSKNDEASIIINANTMTVTGEKKAELTLTKTMQSLISRLQ